MPRSPLVLGAGLLSAALLLPCAADAQLYQWVDERGRMHMTDDLSRVPPAIRARVERESTLDEPEPAAPAAAPSVTPQPAQPVPPTQGVEPAPAAPPAPAAAERDETPTPRRYVIPVARAGLELSVNAELNGRVPAVFKVDTGASINTIPRALVDELGIVIDDSTPIAVVAGISGQPILVPVVTLRQVRIGDAVVEQVDAAVLDTMSYGLLGMPFFNNFRVQTDPTAGRLTLEEIDLATIDGLYGGYGEDYWRSRFAMIREQLAHLHSYRVRIPEEFGELHERLDTAEGYWRGQYETLELRASREGVPRAWRD
jgi:hypothetical protein